MEKLASVFFPISIFSSFYFKRWYEIENVFFVGQRLEISRFNFTDNRNLSIILHSLRKMNFILITASRTTALVVTEIRACLFYSLILWIFG